MTDSVVIASADRQTSLTLSVPDVLSPDMATYVATLTNHAMRASVRTHDTHEDAREGYSRLRPFFDDLAANWKGWSGEKTLESFYYGDLTIHASHNGRSHALLKTTLTEAFADWSATETIHVELGQLEIIAKQINTFVKAIRG